MITKATPAVAHVQTPAPRREWLEIAESDDSVFVTQTPAWTDAACRATRYADASRLYEFEDGRRFVLPLLRKSGRIPGMQLEMSFPAAWGVGGLVGKDLDAGAIRQVLSELRERHTMGVRIRPNPTQGQLWREATSPAETLVSGRFHSVSLGGGADAAWAQLSKSARKAVRTAEKAGVVISCDDAAVNMGILYDLTVKATTRWAEQQNEPLALARLRHRRRDPLSKLQAIAECLGSACKLWIAWQDGEPIGANLVLQGRNAHATRGALDPDRGRLTRAGYLLDWHAIRDAAEAGCRWYHLGESGASESLAEYKERFGARAYTYEHVHVERLPLTELDRSARQLIKRAIRFRD